MNSKISCHCCQTANAKNLPGFESSRLLLCDQCGLVFDCRIPTEYELTLYYKNYSYSSLKPCSGATIRSYARVLDTFEENKIYGNILDIGCGQGDFLCEARNRGWKAFGSEYSDGAISLCAKRSLNVTKEPINKHSFGHTQFDVITCFEVIEHTQTPNRIFEVAFQLLRPGGVFYLTTPNFNSILRFFEKSNFAIISYPEHLCFFSKKTIRHLASIHNFVPRKITTTGLDLERLRKSLPNFQFSQRSNFENFHTREMNNNLIRAQIDSSSTLHTAKTFVNFILGTTGTGDTIKAWLVKKDTQ